MIMPSQAKKSHTFALTDEAEMVALGRQLAAVLPPRLLITLSGELGAGKSVLARSLIQALGYKGRIKSPTYALMETYEVPPRRVAHLDLYRLDDPEELHYLGFDDVLSERDLILVEWPEKAEALLRRSGDDRSLWQITIEYVESGRRVTIDGLESLPE